MQNTKVVIGCDHGGFEYKEEIKKFLFEKGYKIIDVGTNSKESCDYPVFAKEAAQKIINGEADKGILICGTGIGMSITANKFKGIRAALCGDTFSAHATRAHNNSNILCLGERVIGLGLAIDIINIWLNTEYEGGRHQKRIDMIE